MSTQLRIGLVGCGVVAHMHLRGAAGSSQVEIVAVSDLREDLAAETAREFGIPTVHRSASDLFADTEIEAIIFAVPTAGRAELAERAFMHGKHVLVEKPFAMNVAEGRRLIAARGSLVAGCSSARYRVLPSAEAVDRFVASGSLGELRMLRCRVVEATGARSTTPPPHWRLKRAINGGGTLANLGCYDLDFLLGVTSWSLTPEVVMAATWTTPHVFKLRAAPGSDAESQGVALVLCREGVALLIEHADFTVAERDDVWEIIGTEASLRSTMFPHDGTKTITRATAAAETGVSTDVFWKGKEDYQLVHRLLLEDFASAVRDGREPKTSLEHALVVQAIQDAIYLSAERGTAVAINEDLIR